MEELKQLIEEWHMVAQNLNMLPKSTRLLIPNCLVSAQSGTGITRILGLLAQFLNDAGLVEFIGDVKYFEFVLNRSDNHEVFTSFARLVENIRSAAGFRGHFKGIARIDISEWIDWLDDVRFHRFLEYASDNSQNILFIFSVPVIEDKKTDEIETTLASYLRIRRLKLCFPDKNELFQYVIERLKRYGFLLEPSAEEMMFKTIANVRELECFDGYKTLKNLTDEIIYEKCSHYLLKDNIISEADLNLFTPDGNWIRQLTQNNETRTKLGFKMYA